MIRPENGPDHSLENTPLLSNKIYEVLKTIVQLWLPALATLYFTLAAVWGWPHAEAVVATFAALATFGGVVLRISTRSYESSGARYDGAINITEKEGQTLYSLELNSDPSAIDTKNAVTFKVLPPPTHK
jgi:hypothetical protein